MRETQVSNYTSLAAVTYLRRNNNAFGAKRRGRERERGTDGGANEYVGTLTAQKVKGFLFALALPRLTD